MVLDVSGFTYYTIGIFIAGFLVSRMIYRRKPAQPCFHHDRAIIAIQHQDAAIPVTIALEACRRCGVPQTWTLVGDWSIEQLRQNPNEIALLERISR